jgi:hypothetical protein
MGMLTDNLLLRGHSVKRWCSDLHHLSRKKRHGENHALEFSDGFNLVFFSSGLNYKPPFSPLRFLDNTLLAYRFTPEAMQHEAPGVIVCSVPTPEMARASSDMALYFGVPLILAARDEWPEVILDELNGLKKIVVLPVIAWIKMNLKVAAKRAAHW